MSMNYASQRPITALDAEAFQSEVIIGTDTLMKMYQWPIDFPKFLGEVTWVTACLPKWVLNGLMEPHCACDLVFGGECNTPKSMPINRFLDS